MARTDAVVLNQAALHAFFRLPNPQGNWPEDFIAPVGRSEILADHIDDVSRDARILEIGCNVGRNLAHLTDRGWSGLEGVEISPHAIRLLRETYPQLENATIHEGAAEDVLPMLDGPYDLVFTMATLKMIHPDGIDDVCDQIVRLTGDVLLIELLAAIDSSRHYPYDLAGLFEDRGMRLVSLQRLDSDSRDVALQDHGAWRFKR